MADYLERSYWGPHGFDEDFNENYHNYDLGNAGVSQSVSLDKSRLEAENIHQPRNMMNEKAALQAAAIGAFATLIGLWLAKALAKRSRKK